MSDKTNQRLRVAIALICGTTFASMPVLAQEATKQSPLPAIESTTASPEVINPTQDQVDAGDGVIGAEVEAMEPREGESLTEYEKRVLREQSRARQEKILWETRAEVAEARAKYENAMADAKKAAQENKESGSDKELEDKEPQTGRLPGASGPQGPQYGPGDGVPAGMVQGPNGKMMRMPQEFQGPKTMDEAESEMFLYSTYGRDGDLIAEVNYNGGVVRVEEGSNIGGWNVAEIKPTWAKLTRDDKERELLMRGAPRDENDNTGGMGGGSMGGMPPNAAGIGEPVEPFSFRPGGML